MSAFRPSYVVVTSGNPGSGGGAGDGKSRVYQFRADSIPSEVINYALNPWQGLASTGLFRLADAKAGDNITVLIEQMPSGAFQNVLWVIPTGFTGTITVSSTYLAAHHFITEAALSAPAYDGNSMPVKGIQSIGPGLNQLLVLEQPAIDGDKIVSLVALTKTVKPAHNITFKDKANTAYGEALMRELLPVSRGLLYTEGLAPVAVRVFSDQLLKLRLRFLAWNTGTKAWDFPIGEYAWTTDDQGRVDFATIDTVIQLPTMNVEGAGSFSFLTETCLVELILEEPATPQDAPTILDGTFSAYADHLFSSN